MQRSVVFRGMMTRKVVAIPDANPRQHDDAENREERKPDDLTAVDDDRSGQERSERAAGIAADLEDRLGKPEASAGAQMRDARSLRVKHRGTDPDEGDPDKDEREIRSNRKHDEA